MEETEKIGQKETEDNKRKHHHTQRKRHHRHYSEEREMMRKMKKLRREKILRPVFAGLFFLILILLIVMIAWAILNPNKEVESLVNRDKDITQNVKDGIRIEELQAEIKSLNEELDECKERIAELEGKLSLSDSNEADSTAE